MEVMESNKKQWVTPRCTVQQFETNEYISACYILPDDGGVLYAERSSIRVETAWRRTPDEPGDGDIKDDILSDPRTIYMGSFYRDKGMNELVPDSTAYGHEYQENWGEIPCVEEVSKGPWGYHYHFTEVTNRS